jgi:hypothetical protein
MSDTARAALRPILDAGALARCRVLDVACEQDHRLVNVVRVGSQGLVMVWNPGADTELDLKGYEGPPVHVRDMGWRSRRHPLVEWFTGVGEIIAACRCGDTGISERWIADRMAEGMKRARVAGDRYP